MNIDPLIFRCWAGTRATPDDVVRSIMRLQATDTGADLLTERESRTMLAGLRGGLSTRAIANGLAPGIQSRMSFVRGDVFAASGGTTAPFTTRGWLKQGHAAAAAIILFAAGQARYASGIIDRIEEQQTDGNGMHLPGLWHAGDRFATWPGSWSWVHHVLPFEDATQVANACVLRAFGRFDAFDRAMAAMRSIVDHSECFLVPFCASVRSGVPEWGRNVSPAAWAIEESARVAMLLAATRVPQNLALAHRMHESINLARLPDGGWPRFLHPRTLVPCYPMADPSDHTRSRGLGLGELTTDRNLSVRSGFDAPTQTPAVLTALLAEISALPAIPSPS
jgi:hypothetical protein